MLAQGLKDVYFLATRYLILPNTMLTRIRYRGQRDLRLHLGCGDDYREGLVNVDGNIRRKKDLWLDLRNRLPFPNESASIVYCSHTLEHLFPYDAQQLLSEICRVLSPDGVARIAVPSFEHCMRIASGLESSQWPRSFPDSISQAINYIFCDGQHKYAYCFQTLKQFAENAGFTRIVDRSTDAPGELQDYDGVQLGKEPRGSLIVDLRR